MAPPMKQPWEDWDDAKKQRVREAIKIADGIKLFKSAGGIGVGAAHAPAAQELVNRGGLTPDEALTLARFKMHEQTTGGDPGWQGPENINVGPREHQPTPAEIDARGAQFVGASPKERGAMIAQEKLAADRSREGFYDDLVGPGPQRSTSDALEKSRTGPAKRKK